MISGVFASLSPEAAQQLLGAGRNGQWGRGALLFHTGVPLDTLYIVQSGSVRLYTLASGGREVTLVVHGAGDLLGAGALLHGVDESLGLPPAEQAAGEILPQQPLYAECATDTEALMLSGETARRLMIDSPEIAAMFSAQLVQQAAALQQHFAALVFQEVSQRLAVALLSLADRSAEVHGQPVWDGNAPYALQDRLSHQELAHMVGSTRETITKLLGEFRNRGLLELGYRRIVLTDKAGLEAAVRAPLH